MLIKILLARTNAIYKTNAENTTSRQPIVKQRIAKSPNPNGSGLLRFNFARYIFLLIGFTTICWGNLCILIAIVKFSFRMMI